MFDLDILDKIDKMSGEECRGFIKGMIFGVEMINEIEDFMDGPEEAEEPEETPKYPNYRTLFNDICYEDSDSAMDAWIALGAIMSTDKKVTVADYKREAGITPRYSDQFYGWRPWCWIDHAKEDVITEDEDGMWHIFLQHPIKLY